jgi:hypothetical protein
MSQWALFAPASYALCRNSIKVSFDEALLRTS